MESTRTPTRFRLADCKEAITTAIAEQDFYAVELWLRRAWNTEPSAALAAWTMRNLRPIADEYCLANTKVAFLRSFTLEPSAQLLTANAYVERLNIDPFIGQFNTYAQDLLIPNSAFYQHEPDITVLAVLTRSIAPELWDGFSSLAGSESEEVIDRVCQEYATLFDHFQECGSGYFIVHSLETPPVLSRGIGDSGRSNGQLECVERINQFLREETIRRPGFCVFDADGLVHQFGASRWHDEQRWQSVRLPMVSDAIPLLSQQWLRYIAALTMPPKKVLVVDLDNTLWNGIVGEDGFENIGLGDSGAGWPHRKLQQALRDLSARGVLLAICSKNNHEDAWKVVQEHPDMLLRPEHFAAVRINWQDKSINLKEIANELNVGIDSLCFLDDNPREQHQVRCSVPEVRVLDVGEDANTYSTAVRNVIGFERIWLNEEDQNRGEMYAKQRSRRELQASSDDLESYLRSLNTVIKRAEMETSTIDRVTQLTQKTNQFNLTTKRYSNSQIDEFTKSTESQVLAYRVSDRFGDSGIVGVAILRFHDSRCDIDSLLLSCRVIGRGIETAILADVVDSARLRHCDTVLGHYVPTDKNAPCADCYENHGFSFVDGDWALNCTEKNPLSIPNWIRVVELRTQDSD